MKITEFFMRRPTLFWSLMAGIIVAGIICFIQMPKLEDPAVAVKQAMVVVPYPGASAHEVELDVALKMEDALRTLPDVKKIKTECHDGSAMLTVEFLLSVPLDELEQRFDLLRRKVNDLRATLPQGCYDPMVIDDMMDVYGIFYAFKGDGYTYPELYKYARMIRRELLSIDGVKRVNIAGNRDEVINIVLSQEQLSRNGLVQRNGFFVSGKPALAICLAMEEDAIVPDVGKAVDKRLAEVMKRIPVGMETEKIFFQPDKVDEAINSFMWNLVESVAIVILVLIFSMGFRSGVIIGFGLILTIALSFPILLTMGTTLQRISLGAFIVAMGMLVDNAIVIMDGILIDKQRGFGPKTYLYRIGCNTALPLLGATIIAASTFLCIYLCPGSAGEYAGDLFLVLCVSLLASWVLALIQVPVCAKSWLPARVKGKQQGEVMNSPVHRFVRRTVAVLIAHRAATLTVAVTVLAVCVFGMTRVKNLFFPDFDYKQFVVEYFLPAQSSPDRVKKDLQEMTALLEQNPAIERVAASMGSAPAHYCLVRPMTSGGDCYGELMVDCKDYATVMEQIPGIRRQLRELYPDAYIRIRKYNFSISTSHTVEVEFSGPDPAVLRQLSRQAEDIMRQCPYVDPYSVENNWKPRGKVFVADYNRANALRAGIERSDVANALMAATDGMTVGALTDQDRTTLVNLQVRQPDGSRITDLRNIPVWSTLNLHLSNEALQSVVTGGKQVETLQDELFRSVPLSNVADDLRLSWDENAVFRVNGQRAIEAECDPNTDLYDATPAKVMASIRPAIDAIPLPDGYQRKWIGESEMQDEAIGGLMKYVPITLFIVLITLLLLFNSWKKAILILLCFPFVFCGITPALLAFRQPFTFMAIVGVQGLVGMMVKNAIVLVDEINRLQTEERMPAYRAVIEATVSRVRPVLMASLTTIVGMIPLLGDPMYGSMAITIMGGLTVGTVITLLLLPFFYTVLFPKTVQSVK